MGTLSEAQILKVLNHLRRKTGIRPIPLSEDERNSGLCEAFVSARRAEPACPTAVPSEPPPQAKSLEEVLEQLRRLRPSEPSTSSANAPNVSSSGRVGRDSPPPSGSTLPRHGGGKVAIREFPANHGRTLSIKG